MNNSSGLPIQAIKGISFSIYSNEEIKKLSVLEVTNSEILDCLGHPSSGGLYDSRLGPNERDDTCETCSLDFHACPGHISHIALPVPVYNPVFFPQLYQLLRGSCMHCHSLLCPPEEVHLILYQLQALDYGLVGTVEELAEIAINTNDISSFDSSLTVLQNKWKKKFEEAIQGLNIAKHQVKSVVECRRKIVKKFLQEHLMKKNGKKCPHCNRQRKKTMHYNMRIVLTNDSKSSEKQDSDSPKTNEEILPEDARKQLYLLWEKEQIILQNLFKALYQEEPQKEFAINMFFMDYIIVPPSKFRRLNVMKGRKYANSQTIMFNEILKDCQLIQNLQKYIKKMPLNQSEMDVIKKLTGKTDTDKFHVLYQQLQRHVNEIFDIDSNKELSSVSKGIKQILEKKEGLFRMNMMGKRVNYAARSVISPDPYINVNEIGVPMVFAKKLTKPEPVSYLNFEKLRFAVQNGPDVYPGATLVQYENGRFVKLSADDPVRRREIANSLLTPHSSGPLNGIKVVHRHLRNGDMCLLNRQPTLHKPSIMAHKARVLPGEKSLRLHYANCKSYNADFDGDEMNCHFPQSLLGQSECMEIVNVNHQYLVPKDGTPLSGLIQDHIIAGTVLTMRGRFFTKDQYHQLLYSALSFSRKPLKLLPPTILKPQRLWSGKQIVSSVIIHLTPEGKKPPTFEGKAKVSSKNWQKSTASDWVARGTPLKGDSMSESEVIIRGGELLCGVIDKAQVGPTPYSLIHVCYELYGGHTSTTMLTALARLFTHYLQYYCGFSMGIEDIIVSKKANKQRRKILKKASKYGREATAKALEVDDPENPDGDELLERYKDAHYNRDDYGLKVLDKEMQTVTQKLNNDIKDVCIPAGLIKKYPENSLQLMIESGAKGSLVNAMQISCNLGQIELEGRRMPLMLNGRTLPSFSAYDTSPGAGGFVAGRFLTGVNRQEYYFHCMAGREGLIDTAVKTSRSGYLQRCLIKHFEGISVKYDHTVRDSDGTVIQFLYGEDGLDILKTKMLKEGHLHLLAQNYDAIIDEETVKMLQNHVDADLPKLKKEIKKWKRKHPEDTGRSPLIQYVEKMKDSGDSSLKQRLKALNLKKFDYDEALLKKYKRHHRKCPDPVNSQYLPSTFGSVSEKLDELISDYIDKNPSSGIRDDDKFEKFKNICYYRAFHSLASPGESVGLLAAQSIGEPSTQMTLNTFHFAGKGEMNVTLGIPRIREILMTASAKIATPTMDLPLLNKPGIEEKAEKLRLSLNSVCLKEVLEDVQIKEFFSIHSNDMTVNFRNYVIRFNFLKYSVYKGCINASPSSILKYMEKFFFLRFINSIKKKKLQSKKSKGIDVQKDTSSSFKAFKKKSDDETDADSPSASTHEPKIDDGDSSGAEDDGDGDATSAKSKMRHDQELEYEEPEDEEMIPESDNENEKDEEDATIKKEIQTDDETPVEENFSETQDCLKYKKGSITEEKRASRVNKVKCLQLCISNYDFDVVRERWCEISLQINIDDNNIDMKTLLETEISNAFVYSVPGIKEAIFAKNPDPKAACKRMLKTDGVNFLEVFNHVDILDVNKVYSNDIHAIAAIYGIEAAAKVLKKEIVNVFKNYGIEVDPRHLSLISDYMTSSGYYRPCNRIGMEGNASPLQQMTFETSKKFLVDSMFMGFEDRLKSPSANIVVGRMCDVGTGSFDLICK